jgi:hypothetical protein
MIRWFRSLFAWRVAFVAGANTYFENAVTGRRRYVSNGLYGPIDRKWLAGRGEGE